MREIVFIKDFATRKKGDSWKCDGQLASQLVWVDKVAEYKEDGAKAEAKAAAEAEAKAAEAEAKAAAEAETKAAEAEAKAAAEAETKAAEAEAKAAAPAKPKGKRKSND